MAQEVYHVVNDSHRCTKNKALLKHERHLQICFTYGPLQFVAIDILGALPKRGKEDHYVVLISDTDTTSLKENFELHESQPQMWCIIFCSIGLSRGKFKRRS